MSWLLIGMAGVVIAALVLILAAPRSGRRGGTAYRKRDETPTAAARVAEETHHGARAGAVQGRGLIDGVGPFTGTMPRRKEKTKDRR